MKRKGHCIDGAVKGRKNKSLLEDSYCSTNFLLLWKKRGCYITNNINFRTWHNTSAVILHVEIHKDRKTQKYYEYKFLNYAYFS